MRKSAISLVFSVALGVGMLAPTAIAQAGQGQPRPAAETETLGNNLSVPALFVPDTTGAPTLRVPCNAAGQAPLGTRDTGTWLVDSSGVIYPLGNATNMGSLGGQVLSAPVVGMTSTGTAAGGYWLVTANGGVYAYGDAVAQGSMSSTPLNSPIVGMADDPTTGGYWLAAADGGVFAFNAPFAGSMGGTTLNSPVVGMAADPSSGGYWLVAADGGVFAFGGAPFRGSMGATTLNSPVVGIAAGSTPGSYWLVAADGGIFAFGGAPFRGSMGGTTLNSPIVAMSASSSGAGYSMVATDGGVFAFGDSTFDGSLAGQALGHPIVGGALYGGYWLQNTEATWSASCNTAATANATASWGSNLIDSPNPSADKPIRVEVSLLDTTRIGDVGYVITNLTPTLEDRYATYGTDGTTFVTDGVTSETRIWGAGATLTIQPSGGGTAVYDGPISAEINSGGAVVYGFNWGGGNTGTSTAAGTYTLTFTIPSPVTITAVVDGSVRHPTVSSSGGSTSTSLEITVG